jgi:hypothetical protein
VYEQLEPQYVKAGSPSGKANLFVQVGQSGITHNADKVVATVSESVLNTYTLEDLSKIDALNKKLAYTVYRISATVDGGIINDSYQLYKLSVNLSDVDLTNAQKAMLTGVYIDSSTKIYHHLGGELSADGRTFTFYSSHAGDHILILSDKLVKAEFTVGDTNFLVNDKVYNNDIAPIIVDGRVMVPLRTMVEALHAEVMWDMTTQTAKVLKDGKVTSIVVGKALPDGMGMAIMINNRTYVPIRFVTQAMGIMITWDENTNTVTVFG